jgi:hypothetical protein
MSNDRWVAEQEAIRSLLEVYERAEHSRQLYERANMAIPEPLRRFLGVSESPAKGPRLVASVPAPDRPAPPDAEPGFISIETKVASPATLAVAVLREVGQPMRAKDVIARVVELNPDTAPGSVANAATKLDGTAIKRTDSGWTLLPSAKAGILFENRVWGPPTLFGKYELAAHRREAVVHLLHAYRSGLQTLQIMEQLRSCPWMHAPVSKELIQDDVKILEQEGRIRRRGHSRKWEIRPGETTP